MDKCLSPLVVLFFLMKSIDYSLKLRVCPDLTSHWQDRLSQISLVASTAQKLTSVAHGVKMSLLVKKKKVVNQAWAMLCPELSQGS